MVLRATSALGRFRRFKLGNDLVDRGGGAFDRVRDGTAAEGAETFPVSRKIHFRDRNVLPLDVTPDIHLGPVEQRLYAHVFAFCRCGDELAPELRRLIFVIPFELRVARRKISLLCARGIFVAPNAGNERIPLLFRERLLQGDRL